MYSYLGSASKFHVQGHVDPKNIPLGYDRYFYSLRSHAQYLANRRQINCNLSQPVSLEVYFFPSFRYFSSCFRSLLSINFFKAPISSLLPHCFMMFTITIPFDPYLILYMETICCFSEIYSANSVFHGVISCFLYFTLLASHHSRAIQHHCIFLDATYLFWL